MTLRKIASLLLLVLDVVIPKGAESRKKPFRKVAHSFQEAEASLLSGPRDAGFTLYQRGWSSPM